MAASGVMTRLAAMAAANSALDLFPRKAGSWIVSEVGLAPLELLDLPIVYRNVLGIRRQIVPEVLDELQFLCRAKVENGFVRLTHSRVTPGRRGDTFDPLKDWSEGHAPIQHTRRVLQVPERLRPNRSREDESLCGLSLDSYESCYKDEC